MAYIPAAAVSGAFGAFGEDDVYARCPRCNVCTDLGTETARGGRIFCSNCGRTTAMTEWLSCGPRELDDASTNGSRCGAPGQGPARPAPARRPERLAYPVASGNGGSLQLPTLLVVGGLLGFILGGRAGRSAW